MSGDQRPVRYCPRCQCDVVMMPDGTCAWCDTTLERECRCGAKALPRQTRCSRCRDADQRAGIKQPPGRPRKLEPLRYGRRPLPVTAEVCERVRTVPDRSAA